MIIKINSGSCYFWPDEIHETIIVALFIPYLSKPPYEPKGSGIMVGLEKQVILLFKSDEQAGCDILSDFPRFLHRNEGMPLLQMRKMLSGRY